MTRTHFFAVLCIGLSASRAGAETLTIGQAVDEAVRHNLTLIAQRANLSVADTQMLTARLRPNPVASFSADHLDLLGTGFDDVNNGGPPEIAFRVDLPIERGAKRERRIDLASASRAAGRGAVRRCGPDAAAGCHAGMHRRAGRARHADARGRQPARVRGSGARQPRARGRRLDCARRVDAVGGRDAAVPQHGSARRPRAGHGARAGANTHRPVATDPIDLADDLRVAEPAADVPDVAAVQQLALATRPDLRSLQLGQARSVADLRLQESLGVIDYTVGAEYRRQQGIAGRSNSLGFFVSAPMPILNRNQGEIARADAEHDQLSRQIGGRPQRRFCPTSTSRITSTRPTAIW